MDVLLAALRQIGTQVCLDCADYLNVVPQGAPFGLHLRHAKLDASAVAILANALDETNHQPQPTLRSFSASYNAQMTDAGIARLVQALPHTTSQLGFVACEMGDFGALAILDWAKRTSQLSMLCIEGNVFSPDIAAQFNDLRIKNAAIQLSL